MRRFVTNTAKLETPIDWGNNVEHSHPENDKRKLNKVVEIF